MAAGVGQLLLSCEGACVRRDGRLVVDGVDLELRRGEVVALLGPNGAGKSTLLDALVGGVAVGGGSVRRLGRVAIALQSPELARRSVLANVELALGWWGVRRSERRARALEALRLFGVDGLAARSAVGLSGGERRRVHLARALAVRPDVLLLDEPFAGLDAEARTALLQDSVAMLRSPGRATLVVVHDRAEAFALADRLVVMIAGRVVAGGPPRELLAAPPDVEVARFLGFDGELSGADGRLMLTRSANVILDPGGPLAARVARAVPLEDGVRLELEVSGDGWSGRVFAVSPLPAPGPGDEVRLRTENGVFFPLG
jgi:ABC-type nitrate/sulfonate/bicarbonate transport system ATPase subunit